MVYSTSGVMSGQYDYAAEQDGNAPNENDDILHVAPARKDVPSRPGSVPIGHLRDAYMPVPHRSESANAGLTMWDGMRDILASERPPSTPDPFKPGTPDRRPVSTPLPESISAHHSAPGLVQHIRDAPGLVRGTAHSSLSQHNPHHHHYHSTSADHLYMRGGGSRGQIHPTPSSGGTSSGQSGGGGHANAGDAVNRPHSSSTGSGAMVSSASAASLGGGPGEVPTRGAGGTGPPSSSSTSRSCGHQQEDEQRGPPGRRGPGGAGGPQEPPPGITASGGSQSAGILTDQHLPHDYHPSAPSSSSTTSAQFLPLGRSSYTTSTRDHPPKPASAGGIRTATSSGDVGGLHAVQQQRTPGGTQLHHVDSHSSEQYHTPMGGGPSTGAGSQSPCIVAQPQPRRPPAAQTGAQTGKHPDQLVYDPEHDVLAMMDPAASIPIHTPSPMGYPMLWHRQYYEQLVSTEKSQLTTTTQTNKDAQNVVPPSYMPPSTWGGAESRPAPVSAAVAQDAEAVSGRWPVDVDVEGVEDHTHREWWAHQKPYDPYDSKREENWWQTADGSFKPDQASWATPGAAMHSTPPTRKSPPAPDYPPPALSHVSPNLNGERDTAGGSSSSSHIAGPPPMAPGVTGPPPPFPPQRINLTRQQLPEGQQAAIYANYAAAPGTTQSQHDPHLNNYDYDYNNYDYDHQRGPPALDPPRLAALGQENPRAIDQQGSATVPPAEHDYSSYGHHPGHAGSLPHSKDAGSSDYGGGSQLHRGGGSSVSGGQGHRYGSTSGVGSAGRSFGQMGDSATYYADRDHVVAVPAQHPHRPARDSYSTYGGGGGSQQHRGSGRGGSNWSTADSGHQQHPRDSSTTTNDKGKGRNGKKGGSSYHERSSYGGHYSGHHRERDSESSWGNKGEKGDRDREDHDGKGKGRRGGQTHVSAFPRAKFQLTEAMLTGPPSTDELAQSACAGMEGDILNMITTQAGSKAIQRLLYEDETATRLIVYELEPHLIELMRDRYANYAVSVIVSALPESKRQALLRTLTADRIVAIAQDKRGTHSLQALIHRSSESDDPSAIAFFLKNLLDRFLDIALEPNSTHVVQKCLQTVREETLASTFQRIVDEFPTLMAHPHGLCVLKVAMTHSADKYREKLLQEVVKHTRDLVENPFGNYAVQHALKTMRWDQWTWGWNYCASIIQRLQGTFALASTQKFSSNVIECVLTVAPSEAGPDNGEPQPEKPLPSGSGKGGKGKKGPTSTTLNDSSAAAAGPGAAASKATSEGVINPVTRMDIIQEIIATNNLGELLNSMYGQYVVKRALAVGSRAEVDAVQKVFETYFQNAANRKTRHKWERIVQEVGTTGGGSAGLHEHSGRGGTSHHGGGHHSHGGGGRHGGGGSHWS